MASTIERHHFLCTRWLLPARARDGVKENGTTKRIQACDTSAFTLIVSLETSYNFRIISKYFYKDFKGCLWHRTIEYRITCACDEINLQLLWTLAHTQILNKSWLENRQSIQFHRTWQFMTIIHCNFNLLARIIIALWKIRNICIIYYETIKWHCLCAPAVWLKLSYFARSFSLDF